MTRLSSETLPQLTGKAALPQYDRSKHGVGIVHIGVGAFHKAHQAVYTDDALAQNGGDWMISGVSLRSPNARDELHPQDGLYSVQANDGENERYRIIGALKEMHVLPENPEAAIAQLARRDVHVVTLTITEKGYCLTGAGALDWNNAEIAHDLKNPENPKSAIGYLAAGLRQRAAEGAGPLTIISCDNISGNGDKLESALTDYLERSDKNVLRWVKANTSFPSTMVDRIVPATTDADRSDSAKALGIEDQACVKTEAFTQWVIEDKFAGPVPGWRDAGALIVGNVESFETAKLRLLNGAHSAIAYLGLLSGHEFVHQVMADVALADFISQLMDDEIMPEVEPPQGLDLADYAASLRQRFQNASLQHRTAQIAMDGSQKLPQRILPVIQQRLADNKPSERLIIVVAAWIAYMTGRGYEGIRPEVNDPMAERVADLTENSGDASQLVRKLLGIEEIFGSDLPQDTIFSAKLIAILEKLLEKGLKNILAETVGVSEVEKLMDGDNFDCVQR